MKFLIACNTAIALVVGTGLAKDLKEDAFTSRKQEFPNTVATNTNRQAYLEEYREAMKYVGTRSRTRETAIRRLETLKKMDPTAAETLEVDYSIAMMWLSDYQRSYGESWDYEKFKQQVEMMEKAYPDRLNDIRMVHLKSTLVDDILPAMKREAMGSRQSTEEERKAIIERQMKFLQEGKDKVVVPPGSRMPLESLIRGALCRLQNMYTLGVVDLEKRAIALDPLIEVLRMDPRTARYAADIERSKRQNLELAGQKLHPNPPESVEETKAQKAEAAVPPTTSGSHVSRRVLWGTGGAGILLAAALLCLKLSRRKRG